LADPKPEGYYSQQRAELVDRLPRPFGRVLDVGCGEGAVGRLLLERGAEAVVGVEPRGGAHKRVHVQAELHERVRERGALKPSEAVTSTERPA
jgi:SAM-dependent methyltransferase